MQQRKQVGGGTRCRRRALRCSVGGALSLPIPSFYARLPVTGCQPPPPASFGSASVTCKRCWCTCRASFGAVINTRRMWSWVMVGSQRNVTCDVITCHNSAAASRRSTVSTVQNISRPVCVFVYCVSADPRERYLVSTDTTCTRTTRVFLLNLVICRRLPVASKAA